MSYLTKHVDKVIKEVVGYDKKKFGCGGGNLWLNFYTNNNYSKQQINLLIEKCQQTFEDNVSYGNDGTIKYVFFVYDKKNQYKGTFHINPHIDVETQNIHIRYSYVSKDQILVKIQNWKSHFNVV